MPIHTVAYCKVNSETKPNALSAALDAVPDLAMTLSSQSWPIFSQEMFVLAGYAINGALVSAQVDAPTLRTIVSPYIVPITVDWNTSTDPNVMCLLPSPWGVKKQDEIGVTVKTRFPVLSLPDAPQVLLWVADRLEAVPAGDNYWIRYTAQAADSGDTPMGDKWKSVKVKFEQTLGAGRYAVIGFQHQCDGLLCARLVFGTQLFRPGTLAVPLTQPMEYGSRPSGARTHSMFYDGSLGVLGYFDSYAPPQIEVLALNGPFNMQNQTHEGYIRIVRVGDASSADGSAMAPPAKKY
jgi:hypothetical protein